MDIDFSSLASRIGADIEGLRGCIIVSRDGLVLGGYPAEGEKLLRPAWLRFAALGDVERGFIEFSGDLWVYVHRGPYAAFAVSAPTGRPGLLIDELEQVLLSAEEARSKRSTGNRPAEPAADAPRSKPRTSLHPEARPAAAPEPAPEPVAAPTAQQTQVQETPAPAAAPAPAVAAPPAEAPVEAPVEVPVEASAPVVAEAPAPVPAEVVAPAASEVAAPAAPAAPIAPVAPTAAAPAVVETPAEASPVVAPDEPASVTAVESEPEPGPVPAPAPQVEEDDSGEVDKVMLAQEFSRLLEESGYDGEGEGE